jgi:hypothetical protein
VFWRAYKQKLNPSISHRIYRKHSAWPTTCICAWLCCAHSYVQVQNGMKWYAVKFLHGTICHVRLMESADVNGCRWQKTVESSKATESCVWHSWLGMKYLGSTLAMTTNSVSILLSHVPWLSFLHVCPLGLILAGWITEFDIAEKSRGPSGWLPISSPTVSSFLQCRADREYY